MKKVLLISALSIALATAAHAGDHKHRDLRGVIVGAGGGALLGQAVGRNTQSTVIGTAIGSVVGYLVGSEMDRHPGYENRVSHRQKQPVRYEYHEPVVNYKVQKPLKRNPLHSLCKESEFLATIDGRPEKIYGTVCKTPHGWELVSQPNPYIPDYQQDSNWHDHDDREGRHRDEYRRSRWVQHRF